MWAPRPPQPARPQLQLLGHMHPTAWTVPGKTCPIASYSVILNLACKRLKLNQSRRLEGSWPSFSGTVTSSRNTFCQCPQAMGTNLEAQGPHSRILFLPLRPSNYIIVVQVR
ncbi:hypothetical protein AB1N83_004849 [Pleurotus pulmonarius]